MTSTLSVVAAGRTHAGYVRRRNEDSMYVGSSLFAVTDGLGGHVAGDVASATAIEVLTTCDRPTEVADLPVALGRAVKAANDALRRKTEAEPSLAGMGTTLVALLCSGARAVLANVGDSRAYRLSQHQDGGLSQITEDHVYENLVSDAAGVPNLPERLARFLDGRVDGRSPDLTMWDLHPGDRFLLCSDGLSLVVPSGAIEDILRSSGEPDEAADQLIARALDQGAPDNVTVVVIDVRTFTS